MTRTPRLLLGVAATAWAVACNLAYHNANHQDGDDPSEVTETAVRATLAPHKPFDDHLCAPDRRPTEVAVIDPSRDVVQGSVRVKRGENLVGLPLQETRFDTLVVGTVAETSVVQVFANPFDEPIEAVYVFPLPDDGAVDDFWMKIGERRIRGVMKRRDEARKTYEAARKQGHSASLLEQERPNIFTQSVANIPPGENIEIHLHVVQPLQQESGVYTLALPTVVGPRFIPGTPTGKRSGGFAPDTDRVPDGSRITPPVVTEGGQTCAGVAISVNIDAGMPVTDMRSKYHAVDVATADDSAFVELASRAVPNRDFELSWRLNGNRPQASLMAQAGDPGGYFTLTVEPPARRASGEPAPRELVFVVDNSGSMSGTPIETAKAAMRKSLKSLGPNDAFQIIRFSEQASALGSQPLLNTPANIRRGLKYIDDMHGMGGTHMIEGIKAALSMPGREGRMRIVLFLTDGYIGNEVDIFNAIEARLGDARLFSLGVGSSPNRHLLNGMAKVGRGAVTYVGPGESPDAVVERFYSRIAHPVLTDIEIDWQGMKVSDVVPARIPDLFVGQPVVVFGKYAGAPSGQAVLRGTLAGKRIELPIGLDFANTDAAGTGLGSMWARKHIDDLLGYPTSHADDPDALERAKEAVIEVALRHRVMTQYTSFVAVDESRVVNPDGAVKTIQVPVEMPAGVSHQGVFGKGGGGTGWGTVGTGSYGMIGRGSATGGHGRASFGSAVGAGYGRGGRTSRVPSVRIGRPKVTGSLDRNIIRRYIRRALPRLRYCYEKQLIAKPKLAGKLSLQFTINSAGRVTVARASGLGDSKVESCVARVLKKLRFPKPRGGSVTVRYPMTLKVGRK